MEGPGWCTSIPETKNYYTRPWASLTLNDANCPHRGVLSAKRRGGGGAGCPGAPAMAHQRASVALCAALAVSLVLPYAYACASTRALPVRSTGH